MFIYETKYSRMDQQKIVEKAFISVEGRPYHFKAVFFLLGPFLNTLPHTLFRFFVAVVFHQKLVFVSSSCFFFFDEVLNFRNRILADQRPELVIQNCQWKCMFSNIHNSLT